MKIVLHQHSSATNDPVGMTKAEEFPAFREFWIERPEFGARVLRVWALLDGPSATGAYEFLLQPGKTTTWNVRAQLYFRRQPDKIGLGPLTSMWLWGDGRSGPADDPRPKVHDCDGLLIRTDKDEWIWRPITQCRYPSLSHYDLAGVRGFGLMQRDRQADHFLDNEARYHRRPSVWIKPAGGWTRGAVELLELPAKDEGIDNVAAWWTPKDSDRVNEPLNLQYQVFFSSAEPPEHTLARAIATRVRRDGKSARVEIDFKATRMEPADIEPRIRADVAADRGDVSEIELTKPAERSRQLKFRVRPHDTRPVELRAQLKQGDVAITETWRYLCPASE